MSETDLTGIMKIVGKFIAFIILSIVVIILLVFSNEYLFSLDTEIFALLLVIVGFTIILLVTWKVVSSD